MNAHALMYVDKPTFYSFIASADERYRYEYVRGWIMQQQAGGSRRHSRIGAAFCAVLHRQLDAEVWSISNSDRLIDVGTVIRYADAVVERKGSASDDSLQTDAPTLIVEVLSPSSEERDLAIKPAEYLAISALDTYIVASQDEVLCYVWQRRPDGSFDQRPQTVKGRDQVIQVPQLGLAIALAEVYRGIDV